MIIKSELLKQYLIISETAYLAMLHITDNLLHITDHVGTFYILS